MIKIRVFDKIHKEMYYPELRYFTSNSDMHIDFVIKDHIAFNNDPDRFIIMQNTGIQDLDNRDLYDKDILKDDEGLIYKIEWDDQFGQFNIYFAGMDINKEKGWGWDWDGGVGEYYNYNKECINMFKIGNLLENADILNNLKELE